MNLTPGQRFGRLVVLSQAPDRFSSNGKGRPRRREKMVNVECDCGERRVVFARNLTRGLSTSCGCLTIERSREVKRANLNPLPSYEVAHVRMRKLHGQARERVCPCGKQAEQWAYAHTDPDELTGSYVRPSGKVGTMVYSLDPAHYVAMCDACHRHYDVLARRIRRAGIYPRDLFPHAEVSAEQAEQMRQAMPEPDAFEVVGDEDC